MKANIARFTIALRNGLESVGELTKVARSIRPLFSAIFLLTLPLAGGAFLALYLNGFFRWPDFSRIQDRRETSIFYAEQGEELREYCTYCREMARLEEMGHFPKLAVLIEDRDFEKRLTPVSSRGIVRALWQDLKTLKIGRAHV